MTTRLTCRQHRSRWLGTTGANPVRLATLLSRRSLLASVGMLTLAAQPAAATTLSPSAIPRPVPELAFKAASGEATSLRAFRGRVVLLNVWATWCVPCRIEMPTLDRLQASLGGETFIVLALSVDRGGVERIRPFFAEIGIANLDIYVDPTARAVRTLGIPGLPTTLLLDRDGQELARVVGPAEWDSEDIQAVIRRAISESRQAEKENP